MAKCTACNSTILFGGVKNRTGQYCNEECFSQQCIVVAGESVPKMEMDKIITEEYGKDCPKCKGSGPLDLHQATKITSYLVAYQISKESQIGCVACGKSMKLKAGIHTLFLGIWSPRGLFLSLIYFPAGVIGSLTTSIGREPSKKFSNAIKNHVGQKILAAANG